MGRIGIDFGGWIEKIAGFGLFFLLRRAELAPNLKFPDITWGLKDLVGKSGVSSASV